MKKYSLKITKVVGGKKAEVSLEKSMIEFYPTFEFLDKCSRISKSTAVRLLQKWARKYCMGRGEDNLRCGASSTDAGSTATAIQQLNVREGPSEAERRDARMTDAGDTLRAIQSLLVGQGPVEGLDRKDARVTNFGRDLRGIAMMPGAGPQEGAERRDARMTNFGQDQSDIAQLQGSGPTETIERKAARITNFGQDQSDIAQLQGIRPVSSPRDRMSAMEEALKKTKSTVSEIKGETEPSPVCTPRDKLNEALKLDDKINA